MMKLYRRDRIKLVKDFQKGQNNLCQSLVDIGEFQNIDKVFQTKKGNYNIARRNVALKSYLPVSQQQVRYDMTATEKLQFYKKQKIKLKFQPQSSCQTQKQMFKIRRSKIPSLLDKLNQSMKEKQEEIFGRQIKTSQEKLKFYRSQGKLKQDMKFSCLNEQKKTSLSRCRFFSLNNGKPQTNQDLFPTFQAYVDGKNRAKILEKFNFDMSKLQGSLHTFYTDGHQGDQQQNTMTRGTLPSRIPPSRKINKNASKRISPNAAWSQRSVLSKTENYQLRTKKAYEINRHSYQFIKKSQVSSKSIVATMTDFHESKNTKRQQYNNMIEYYDHDRPVTNSIRRHEYSFNSGQKLKPLNCYRDQSQHRRLSILQFNSRVYMQILECLSKYHQDDIPVSLQILDGIRGLMRRDYVFSKSDVQMIFETIKKRGHQPNKSKDQQNPEDAQQDFMVQPLIDILNAAYKYTINWASV